MKQYNKAQNLTDTGYLRKTSNTLFSLLLRSVVVDVLDHDNIVSEFQL